MLWLLHLRRGEPLPAEPNEIASRLARLYEREGFTSAKVTATFAAGTLTITVDEGVFDAVAVEGATPALEARFERALADAGVRAGAPFNEPAARSALRRVLADHRRCFSLRDLDIVDRAGRRVLRIGVHRSDGRFWLGTSTNGREDFFSPVDGFSPSLGFSAVAYDRSGFNYTYVGGYASWKFGRDDAGYSLGVERPLLSGTRLFLGAEMHDLTASDDLWRLSNTEQTVAAAGFKNTFRDYYRRRGVQAHIGARPADNHEVVASWRRDRHQPLANESDFSLFRDDHPFRANALVDDAELHAVVLGYSFDSLGLRDESLSRRFARHLVDDLFRASRRGSDGWRVDWTSEIAGSGLGGDYDFTRHILNARGSVRLTPRQSVAARGIAGWSSGSLPLEREFAIGGVGSVHGYKFKEAAGSRLVLLNGEYTFDVSGDWRPGHSGLLRALVFFDAGRVGDPVRGSRSDWLKGSASASRPADFGWNAAFVWTTCPARPRCCSAWGEASDVPRLAALALTLTWFLAGATTAFAEMGAYLNEVRAIGPTVRASIDLRDVFSEKYRAILKGGGILHVRIQAEVWEDRPLWDKLVRPALISVFRIIRDPNNQISVSDAVGVVISLPWDARRCRCASTSVRPTRSRRGESITCALSPP